jgi:hypothetical protein
MQQLLSTHFPLDFSADWSDVDVDLPVALHLTVFSAERLARLRALFRHGLVNGILSPSAVEAAIRGDGQSADALETHHLLQVIGDLGIDVAEIDGDDCEDGPADGTTAGRNGSATRTSVGFGSGSSAMRRRSPIRVFSKPPINAASVGHPDDQHDEALIDDRVDDSIVTDPNPHQVMAFQLL